jgi:hypothetical protein
MRCRRKRGLRVFEDESVRTYAQAAEIIGVSRERVYQLTSLVTKLSPQIVQVWSERLRSRRRSTWWPGSVAQRAAMLDPAVDG